MRKCMACVMVLSFLIGVFCQSVAALDTPQSEQGEFKVETVFKSQSLLPNQMLTAKATVTNISATSYAGTKDVMAVVALYNGDNTMMNISYISKGIPWNGTETLSAGFKLPSDLTGHKVKVFVWDGTDLKSTNMIPLSNEAILSADEVKVDLPVVGSFENLKTLLEQYGYSSYVLDSKVNGTAPGAAALPTPAPVSTPSTTHSGTNNQVDGVDEADIVQTDGQYIYQVNNKRIVIADAYPAEKMKIASIVNFDDQYFYPRELYIADQRLVVIGTGNTFAPYYSTYQTGAAIAPTGPASTANDVLMNVSTCKAIIYDTSDKSNIKKIREVELEGSYLSSRKIGSVVYLVSNKYFSIYNMNKDDKRILPAYRDTSVGNDFNVVDYSEIRYIPEFARPTYTIIAGFDISNAEDKTKISAYLGNSQNMYVSEQNMYLAATDYMMIRPMIALPPVKAGDVGTTTAVAATSAPVVASTPPPTTSVVQPVFNYDNTLVYKFALDAGAVKFSGKGEVPGRILNQFSMDEYNSYFRIATTSSANTSNNLYVMDEKMEIKGKLEGMAPGERIYSSRFIGEKAFIVTFRQVDPLFVIDLKDPAKPAVLGQLKIPGYSDYLEPYDENHLIGFGKDTVDGLMQGVKLALFDVSDVTNPIQEFSETIGTRGTSSELNYNHKALLFDRDKNLFAFPITVYENTGATTYGSCSFQGLYVYNIDLTKGFVLKGKITHISGPQPYYYYGVNNEFINRALYIDDVLYSVSNAKISANRLDDLKEISTLSIPQPPTPTPVIVAVDGIIPTPVPLPVR